MESLSRAVQAFNELPRPQVTPTGLPSHWMFGIRHVPLPPEGDLVYVVHPRSYYSLTSKKPAQIVSLNDSTEKAKAVLPGLLSAFLEMGHAPPGSQGAPVIAPWTWLCVDADMAPALQTVLHEAGVREDLCKVGVASASEKDIWSEQWSGFVGSLMKTLGLDAATKKEVAKRVERNVLAFSSDANNVCAHCCCGPSQDNSLKTCAGCRTVWYCSRDCQKAGWKSHKRVCGKSEDAVSQGVCNCPECSSSTAEA